MKIIGMVVLSIVLSCNSLFAYTDQELELKKENYIPILKEKIENKIKNISGEKLKKVPSLVDTFIKKYEKNTTLDDNQKLKKIAILLAFREIVSAVLLEEYSDIDTILNIANKKLEIILISDKRCGEKCNTTEIIKKLRQTEGLKGANIVELDFSSTQAKNILKISSITKLPAVIFPDKSIGELTQFLKPTTNKSYFLELGSTFDPYIKRSEKGFNILDENIFLEIKGSSYISGDKNAKILWLEYSDMECPFCAKLHNVWTPKDLREKYQENLSYSLQHFPLGFHKNALPAAHYLECVGKIKWKNAFYSLEEKLFAANKSDQKSIIAFADELWVDDNKLEKCVEDRIFSSKITAQQKRGAEVFWITGTPWNVLLNTETLEYEVISWAYPTSEFIKVIDKLLK